MATTMETPLVQSRPNALPWLAMSGVLIALDQVSKWLATSSLPFEQRVSFVPEIWNWHLTHNKGAAFSFLASAGGWQHAFFVVLAFLISIALMVALKRTPRQDWRTALPFALIISGALGNVIDRLRFGYVVDFVEWYWKSFYWPVFNIADSCIVVGATAMVLFSFRNSDKGKVQ